MTENANPKPFNIIRQKCQRRLSSGEQLGLSVNQSTDPFTVKLAEQKDYQKCNRFVYRLG